MTTQGPSWKVGELARQTGLTVRTLHHYEDKGLLVPSARTESGYRLYSGEDVERLYRILALRQLGIPLAEIGQVLAGDSDLSGLLTRQLEEVDRQLQLGQGLRRKLHALLAAVATGPAPTEQFIQTMEVITRMDRYFTPEQQADLARRAEALGPGGMQKAEQDWATLIADVRAEMDAGTAADDARMAPLAERWRTLIRAFTGGDLGIARGVAQQYKERGVEATSHGMMDSSVMEFMGAAMQHNGGW